ncbi:hypothetical protein RUMHYD_03030 [Blautia hydrogenotrophica DSM 10507]|uniref:Uncharacterized protein n=1 Tax=Blautia hydrogenotrophica (strain DSM 10507 / JCM 14656 / S5a33) TaxID=476272 RepID=C0CQ77_BLAHS|nr:hypothetical protein RUMHYD_03030 [Blautia hydrogenotrophica DSM 10507]
MQTAAKRPLKFSCPCIFSGEHGMMKIEQITRPYEREQENERCGIG